MDYFRQRLELLLSDGKGKSNSNRKLILENFRAKIKKLPANKAEKLANCSRHPDRIQTVKEYFKWIPLDPITRSKYQKNNDVLVVLQNLANNAFKERKWLASVRLYNLAILFAVSSKDPNLELANVYGNRAAALFHMGFQDQAIPGIDLALQTGFAEDPRMWRKMFVRKFKFEAKISHRSKNLSLEEEVKDRLADMNELYKELFTVKTPNPKAPALDASVAITYTAERGRHLVAKEDIPMGTTVLVERPMVSILTESLDWEVEHCHHCFKKNLWCIPCHNCVFTLYCNEKCREEAREYHQYECPCLPDLRCNFKDYVGGNFQLAFKLICILGPEKLFDMYIKKKENKINWKFEGNNEHIAGSDPATGIYESNSYRAIYNLCETIVPSEVHQYLLYSLILAHTLDSNSDFFTSVTHSRIQKEEFEDFVAELIAHHFETIRRNGFGLLELFDNYGVNLRGCMEPEPTTKIRYGSHIFASGVFSTASLINHSCDQNVMRFVGHTFGTMTFITLRELKKGQELTTTYWAEYGSLNEQENAKERRDVLSRFYGFTCDCNACENDWPISEELANWLPTYCCPLCSAKFTHESKSSSEFSNCKLSGDFKCKLCNWQYDPLRLEYDYESHRGMLQNIHKMLEKNVPRKVISFLKFASEYFENHVSPPNYNHIFGQEIFRDAVRHAIFFSDSQS